MQTRGNTGEGQTAKTPAQLAEETKQTTGNVLSNAAATAQACALFNASLCSFGLMAELTGFPTPHILRRQPGARLCAAEGLRGGGCHTAGGL